MSHDVPAAYFQGTPLRPGPGPHLLLDDSLVEDRWRLTRELHLPEKYLRNPVLVCDQPWEGAIVSSFSVFFDDAVRKYRMWYNSYQPFGAPAPGVGRSFTCYAESDDGFNWRKPLFDRYPVGDSARTNIVYTGTHRGAGENYGAAIGQVFRDDTDPAPRRRYKMICYEARPAGGKFRRGVNLAVSPDGYEWTLDGDRHLLDYQSDFTNHVVFDPVAGHWLLYCRPRLAHATGLQPTELITAQHPAGRHTSRRLAVMTSRDFRTWSYPRTCFYPDEHDATDYDALGVFRCGGHFLMLYAAMAGDDDGTKDLRLAWSRDGLHWERHHSREPFLPRGRPGDWDAGQVMRVSTNPPIRRGENLLIYYAGATKGQYDWHGHGGVGVAVTPVDRFVMQRAGDEPGYLITREFVLEGNRLRANSFYRKTKDCVHHLKAEILRHPELGGHADFRAAHDGFSLADCDPIKENGTDALVTWQGNPDLSALQGRPVYVRFELKNMGLFSFRTPQE